MRIFILVVMVLCLLGCFDGERGVLTELVVQPVDAPVGLSMGVKPDLELAPGTGSELVISPIPAAMKDRLFGDWDDALAEVTKLLARTKGFKEFPDGEIVEGRLSQDLYDFCDRAVDTRAFYNKYIDAGGIAIIAPTKWTSNQGVRDEFLYMAREVILTMTSARPALRRALSPGKFRYVLYGNAGWYKDVTMPEELGYSVKARGYFGGVGEGSAAFGGFATTYNEVTQSFRGLLDSGTVIHEFAHAIDSAFDKNPHLFPNWDRRLRRLYAAAVVKAEDPDVEHPDMAFFPAGSYPLLNQSEYWAEAAFFWFLKLHGEHEGWRREWLLEWDPGLYQLLDDVFPAVDLPRLVGIAGE